MLHARVNRGLAAPSRLPEMVLGHRIGSNPARYADRLQLVLPRSKKRSQVKHHPALPWKTSRRLSVNWSFVHGARRGCCTCLSSRRLVRTRYVSHGLRSLILTVASGLFRAIERKAVDHCACHFASEPSRSYATRYRRRSMDICFPAARKGAHCRTWRCCPC